MINGRIEVPKEWTELSTLYVIGVNEETEPVVLESGYEYSFQLTNSQSSVLIYNGSEIPSDDDDKIAFYITSEETGCLFNSELPYFIKGNSDIIITKVPIQSDSGGGSGSGEVTSVNGKKGAVIIGKTDIGLGNVNNTSDKDKPISTAQQNALDSKQQKGDYATINDIPSVLPNPFSLIINNVEYNGSSLVDIEINNDPSDVKNGYTFIPSVDELASNKIEISWTNNGDLPNPEPVVITAPAGAKGDPFTFQDFTPDQLLSITGENGSAATIEIGTVTNLPAGSAATVTNVGSEFAAIFNFGIPEGQKGDPGTNSGGSAYDDTEVRALINNNTSDIVSLKADKADKTSIPDVSNFITSQTLQTELGTKVDKVSGKSLSTNDFTDVEKNKLTNLENYNDTEILSSINSLQTELESKADKTSIPDVSNFVTSQTLQTELESKVDKVSGKSLSTNDFTDVEKNKLTNLENYNDTEILSSIDNLQQDKADKSEIPTKLPNPNNLTINGTNYDGSAPVILNIEGGSGGANLATDEEWNTGTSTVVAPNVAQVKLGLASQSALEPFTYPASRFTIVDGNKDVSLANNTLTIDEIDSNLLYSAPCTAITSNSNIIQTGNLSLDVALLENGVYYVYYDNEDNTLKTTRVFLQSGGKPANYNIYTSHELQFSDFNSSDHNINSGYYYNLIDNNYATWFPFSDASRANAFLEVLIPEKLYGVDLLSITYTLENNGTRNPSSKVIRTEAVYTDDRKVTIRDLACAPNQKAVIDLSNVDVTGLKSIRFTRTSTSAYSSTMTQVLDFFHSPIGFTDDDLPTQDIIQLDNRWLNFNVKKYDATTQRTYIVDIVMLGYITVASGAITNVHNYAFGQTHYDYDLYSLDGSTPRQLFDTAIADLTARVVALENK